VHALRRLREAHFLGPPCSNDRLGDRQATRSDCNDPEAFLEQGKPYAPHRHVFAQGSPLRDSLDHFHPYAVGDRIGRVQNDPASLRQPLEHLHRTAEIAPERHLV
jgi:hypothetical protein